jgi:prevent-host-death family protein
MGDSYSLYEAKAQLSAIIRRVRQGRPATITLHGKPVAEIRALPESEAIAERLERLTERGAIAPAAAPSAGFPLVARRRGALRDFLAERED